MRLILIGSSERRCIIDGVSKAMGEPLSDIIMRFGVPGLIGIAVLALCVWGVAHWTADPGTEVSVLFGLAKYTKRDALPKNAALESNPLIIRFRDDPKAVERVIAELEARQGYETLRNKYVSYEVAQLVAFSAHSAESLGFSVEDIYAGLDYAAKSNNRSLCVNMVEIGGNLGMLRRENAEQVRNEIASRIEAIAESPCAKSEPHVQELCQVKLTIFGRRNRDDLKHIINKFLRSHEPQHSVYELGLFENPDYWLPYVVGQLDLGDARFYAAYLIRSVTLRDPQEVIYHLNFLLEQEGRRSKPDQDVIAQLKLAKDELIRRTRK